jgi:hypothetical protein
MEVKIIKKTKVNQDLSAEHFYYGKIKGKWNLYFTDNLKCYFRVEDVIAFIIILSLVLLPAYAYYTSRTEDIIRPLYIGIIFFGLCVLTSFLGFYYKQIRYMSYKTALNEAFDKYDDNASMTITNAVDKYIQYNKLKDKNYKDSITKITINSRATNCNYCNSSLINNKCQGCGFKS